MTAIDFAAFVDQLAGVAGETILPFFRTALSVRDKGSPGAFDPWMSRISCRLGQGPYCCATGAGLVSLQGGHLRARFQHFLPEEIWRTDDARVGLAWF